MSVRRNAIMNLLANSFKWLPYSFEYLYHSLIPQTIGGKQVKNKARVNTIYGNSVVENQLVEDDFGSSISYWGKNRLTQSNSNNIATFTTNSNAYNFVSVYHSFSAGQLVKGNYYIYSLYFRITSGSCSRFEINHHGTRVAYVDNPTLNQWHRLVGIVQQTRENTETTNGFDITRRYASTSDVVVNSDTFEAKEPMLIDLTQMFPFDTPTTLTDNRVQAILNRGYIPYNAGEIKSVDIGEFSSEPYNLFDEEWVLGNLSGSANTFNCSSKNYIKVVGGKSYSFDNGSFIPNESNGFYYREYDENYNQIGSQIAIYGVLGQENQQTTFIVSNETRYIKFFIYVNNYNFTNNFPKTISIHHTGTRTGYAPHTSPQTLQLKYQGGGVGTAHDTFEITSSEYVFTKNINKYTFTGSETWTQYNTENSGIYRYATSVFSNNKIIENVRDIPNIVCNKYIPTSQYKSYRYSSENVDKSITLGTSGSAPNQVFVMDTSVQSASDMSTNMQGKTLVYELATPQVIRIPRKHLAIVDLGSLNWVKESVGNTYDFYSVGLSSIIKPATANNQLGNIVVSNWNTLDRTSVITGNNDKVISVDINGVINVVDNSYNSLNATQFKNAMQGIYLFYETAEEVDDIATEIAVEAGGTLNGYEFAWIKNQQFTPTTPTQAYNGITKTYNSSNNTFHINGTTTSSSWIVLGSNPKVQGHKYFFYSSQNLANIGAGVYFYNNGGVFYNSFIYSASNSNADTNYLVSTNTNLLVDFDVCVEIIDLTIAFGSENEPTSVDDPRIKRIIELGYIPTNVEGTYDEMEMKVLPNVVMDIQQ